MKSTINNFSPYPYAAFIKSCVGFSKNLIFLGLFLWMYFPLMASPQPVLHNVWSSDLLNLTDTYSLQDDQWPFPYPTDPAGFKNINSLTYVILSIDPEHPKFFDQAYQVEMELEIEHRDEKNNAFTRTYELEIDFDPAKGSQYKAKSYINISRAYKLDIKILNYSVNGVPNAALPEPVQLEVEMHRDRFFFFDCTSTANFTSIASTTRLPDIKRLEVNWDPIDGAIAYELEWTFVNDYDGNGGTLDPSNLEYSFRNNSTRVVLDATEYAIENLFPRGYLIFRVRGIGEDYDNITNYTFDTANPWRLEGAWNTLESGFVSSVAIDNYYHLSVGHEPDLNWQVSTSYAEEGKHKSVVSYFDGSLRSRQSVTHISTDDQTLAGEVIYDYYGRAGVQTLPTPTGRKYIEYYPEFNLNSDGQAYNWENFAETGQATNIIAEAMHPNMAEQYGAALYYSSDNPNQSGAQAYLPDAEGYPFSQIEYTPDNTGRVRRQSGVGPTHRLGSDHETKYWYGAPGQEELDQVFGSDVGHAERYRKEMIQDANGQISISYKDAHGRVIATALAGDHPDNLEALPSYGRLSPKILELSDKNDWIADGPSMEVVHDFLVSSPGRYTVNYSFSPNSYEDEDENCPLVDLCLDCVYDLTISITDECGEEQLLNGAIETTIGPIGSVDALCNAADLFEITNGDNVYADLEIGAYKISKRLSINQEALDAYVELKLEEDDCLLDLEDFVQDALDDIDYSGCGMNACEFECQFKLGPIDEYKGTDQEYNIALAECKLACAEETICEGFLNVLRMDLSPGGQYALYEETADGISFPDNYSILDENNSIGNYANSSGSWKNPISAYRDAYGNLAKVNGEDPENLSLEEFIANWEPSWADALLEYHPDYCNYIWCSNVQASLNFDNELVETESYEDAVSKGFFDISVWSNIYPYIGQSGFVPPFSEDPYFTPGLPEISSYRSEMIDAMAFYISNPAECLGAEYNMWEAAIIGVRCNLDPSTANCQEIEDCVAAEINLNDPCDLDEAWVLFRSMYLGAKAENYNNSINFDDCQDNNPHPSKLDRTLFQEIFPLPTSTDLANEVPQGVDQHCEDICEGYVNAWLESLEGCAITDVNDRTEIIDRFKAICQGSCDINNPLGSNIYNNESFQDVLIDVLGLGAINANCTADLISMPSNPGTIYTGGNASIPYMDECACDLILENEAEFLALSASNQLPPGVSSREDLFFETYGLEVHNLSGKACDCNAAFAEGSSEPWTEDATWSPASETFLENLNTPIAAEITCPRCQDCSTITGLVNQFISDNPSYIDSENAITLLETYMNRALGFTLSGQQYLDFYEQCENGGAGDGNPSGPSGPANQSTGEDGCLFAYGMGGTDYLSYLGLNYQTVGDYGITNNGNPTGMGWTAMAYDETNGWMYGFSACQNPAELFRLDVRNQSQQALYLNGLDPSIDGIWAAAFDNVNNELYVVALANQNQHLYKVNLPYYSLSYKGFIGLPATNNNCELGLQGIQGMAYDPAASTLYAVSYDTLYQISTINGSPTRIGALPPADFRGLSYDHVEGKLYGLAVGGAVYQLDPQTGGSISQLPDITNGQPMSAMAYVPSPDCIGEGGDDCVQVTETLFEENFDAYPNGTSNDPGRWNTNDIGNCTNNDFFGVRNGRFESYLNNCPLPRPWHMEPVNISGKTEVEILVDLEHYYTSVGQTVIVSYILDGGPEQVLSTYIDVQGVSNLNQTLTGLNNSTLELKVAFDNGDDRNWVFLDYVKISATGCQGDSPPDPTGLRLCDEPLFPRVSLEDNCAETLTQMATFHAEQAYEAYIAEVTENFVRAYTEKCLDEIDLNEQFNLSYSDRQHHYTLYYYDQGGNLFKTVPPKGVDFLTNAEIANVHQHRQGTGGQAEYPSHSFKSTYVYNSLQQLTHQESPDAGASDFYYDRLGRIVVGQNARQAEPGVGNYSYTLYDAIGRVVESGEMSNEDITATDTRDEAELLSWIQGGNKLTYTHTAYDQIDAPVQWEFEFELKNLRGRVANMDYVDLQDDTRNMKTYFSYDVLGNVEKMHNYYPDLVGGLADGEQDHVTVETKYIYDLISGNVKEVVQEMPEDLPKRVSPGYRFEYDADNRLIKAESRGNWNLWDTDATYHYYDHGPLARTEIGEEQVQGMDYAYSLQGWLKGVNASSLGKPERDIGKDGELSLSNPHRAFGRDAFGFTLGFYEGDYSAIGNMPQAEQFEAGFNNNYYGTSLFNGNINHMVTALSGLDAAPLGNQISLYQYDQLNRIMGMQVKRDNWAVENINTWGNNPIATDLETQYTYDADGNIRSLKREGNYNVGAIDMDDLSYEYEYDNGVETNRLLRVIDAIPDWSHDKDIDSQDPDNYSYDETGNLISDISEEIQEIIWTVDNKIQEVIRTPGSQRPNLEFRYDPSGNRICKIVKPQSGELDWVYTYYMRDAAGQVLSTVNRSYRTDPDFPGIYIQDLKLNEQHLYGSGRLGVQQWDSVMEDYGFTAAIQNGFLTDKQYIASGYNGSGYDWDEGKPIYRGKKRYEFTNHLSNVIGVVSDRKHGVDRSQDGLIDFYVADVHAYSDYYPFGMKMIGRNDERGGYRYGFNGKEDDEEYGDISIQDYGFRIYNPALGKFLSVDPLTSSYPWYTPYQFAGNTPIQAIDLDGLEAAQSGSGSYEGETKERTFTSREEGDFTLESIWHNGSSTLGTEAGWYTGYQYRKQVIAKIAYSEGSNDGYLARPSNLGFIDNEFDVGSYLEFNSIDEYVAWYKQFEDSYQNAYNEAYINSLNSERGVLSFNYPIFEIFSLGVGSIPTKLTSRVSIALGKRRGLKEFAEKVGAFSDQDWIKRGFYFETSLASHEGFDVAFNIVTSKVIKSNGNIHFNLSGVSLKKSARIGKAKLYEGGNSPFLRDLVTEWELQQVISNPQLLKRTAFYKMGIKIPQSLVLKYYKK